MKCLNCGHEMTTGRENVPYDRALPGVTLVDVEVSRCPNCGEHEVAIPNLTGLHQTLANMFVRKSSRLTGAEVRFLRKYLGFSGADFAAAIGSDPATISKWETGKERMSRHMELLLRVLVRYGVRYHDYPFAEVAKDEAPSPKYRLTPMKDGWQPEAA